ncbi:translation initiation factor 3 subunit K, partial [Phenoliferia sp. Uapishka_3]
MVSQLNPSTRPQVLTTLIEGVDCHLLEDYLRDQLSKDQYDLLANLALLKLYQFNPTLCSPTAVLSILFLSLAHAPFSPDFTLAWSLLSDSFVVGGTLPPPPQSSSDDDDEEGDAAFNRAPAEPHGERETAEQLRDLSSLLLARKFRLFWQTLRTPGPSDAPFVRDTMAALLASATGFEARVRDSISLEIVSSFKGIEKKMLESFLGVEAGSPVVAEIIAKRGWTLEGTVVHIPSNESNSPTSTLQREQISIDHIGKLVASPESSRDEGAFVQQLSRASTSTSTSTGTTKRKRPRTTTSGSGKRAADPQSGSSASSIPLPHYTVVRATGANDKSNPHIIKINPGVTDGSPSRWPQGVVLNKGHVENNGSINWYEAQPKDEGRHLSMRFAVGNELAERLDLKSVKAGAPVVIRLRNDGVDVNNGSLMTGGQKEVWILDAFPDHYKYFLRHSGRSEAKDRIDPSVFGLGKSKVPRFSEPSAPAPSPTVQAPATDPGQSTSATPLSANLDTEMADVVDSNVTRDESTGDAMEVEIAAPSRVVDAQATSAVAVVQAATVTTSISAPITVRSSFLFS